MEADPGSGKTTLADSANQHPDTYPALHLDMRGNTLCLGRLSSEHFILEMDGLRDFVTVVNWLIAGQPDEGPVHEIWPGKKFKTLIVDTLTQYHNWQLAQIVGDGQKKFGQPLTQPQIQHWGELLRQTSFLLGTLAGLKEHVIITVQSEESKDEVTGSILHRPQLWGRSQKEVPAFVYMHAYLIQGIRLPQRVKVQVGITEDVNAETRIALFTPRFDSMAKEQYGKVGTHMIDPSIPKIMDLLHS